MVICDECSHLAKDASRVCHCDIAVFCFVFFLGGGEKRREIRCPGESISKISANSKQFVSYARDDGNAFLRGFAVWNEL